MPTAKHVYTWIFLKLITKFSTFNNKYLVIKAVKLRHKRNLAKTLVETEPWYVISVLYRLKPKLLN